MLLVARTDSAQGSGREDVWMTNIIVVRLDKRRAGIDKDGPRKSGRRSNVATQRDLREWTEGGEIWKSTKAVVTISLMRPLHDEYNQCDHICLRFSGINIHHSWGGHDNNPAEICAFLVMYVVYRGDSTIPILCMGRLGHAIWPFIVRFKGLASHE